MHQGNLFVDQKGNIIPVDFGIMGRLDKTIESLAEILYGFIQRDYTKVAEVHFQAGLVPQDASKEEFAQALRSVESPFHNRQRYREGIYWLSFLKSLKNLICQHKHLAFITKNNGCCGRCCKNLSGNQYLEVSRPVLEDWLKDIKSPKSSLDTAINTSAEIIKRIPDFPDLMDKANYALHSMAEGKLNIGLRNNKSLEMEQMRLKTLETI